MYPQPHTEIVAADARVHRGTIRFGFTDEGSTAESARSISSSPDCRRQRSTDDCLRPKKRPSI